MALSRWACPGFVAMTLVLANMSCPAEDLRAAKIEQVKEFSIIGIEARTNNAREMSGNGIIGKQWSRFYQERLLEKIPNKIDSTVYAVYTDYSSDRNGDYAFVIGAKVRDTSQIPSGMVAKKIPQGKYAVFTTAKGAGAKVVPETWQRVWDLEDKAQLGGHRAYKADFEAYNQPSQDPQNSQVDIYVGLQ